MAFNTTAAYALTALCRLRDPRAAAYLEKRLSATPVDLSGLKEPIDRIGPWAEGCREPLVRLIPDAPEGNDRIAVIGAVGRFYAGADADEVRDLVRALRRQCDSHPHITSRVFGDLGPAAAPATRVLRSMLRHDQPYVRLNAARALWRISGDPGAALPALRAAIDEGGYARTHALSVLIEMGTAGAGLAGLLPPLFGSDDAWVSMRAAIAHWHITGDAAPVVPVLLGHLEAGPRGVEAVRCLADIGAPAAAAAPALREGAKSDMRQVDFGSPTAWIENDEEWARACAEALTRIT